jgi:cell division protein FtsW (lipid II flippase)
VLQLPDFLLWLIRFPVPLLALAIVYKAFESLLRNRRDEQTMATLVDLDTEVTFPIRHWESSIGRSKSSDIVLPDPTVSRSHAVLSRRSDGWYISDTKSKFGVYVNDVKIEQPHKVVPNDVFTLGSRKILIRRADIEELEAFINPKRIAARKRALTSGKLFFILVVFQLLTFFQPVVRADPEHSLIFGAVFGGFLIFEILFYIINVTAFKRKNFEIETVALMLSGIGLVSIAGILPDQLLTQAVSIVIGIILFELIIWFIRDMNRVMKFRRYIGTVALLLLAATLVLGRNINGATNWIRLGSLSIQPSELTKIAFIFAGASTLTRLQQKDSLALFLIFCGACIVSLFLMRDFGTALIFFVTLIIIAFMRSGDFRTIVLVCAATAIGAFIIVLFRPYIIERFTTWRHAWEFAANGGYQQVKVNIATASGGLFGNGIGFGWLKNVAAAASDLVFGVLCEEWGILFAFIIAAIFPVLAFTAYKYAPVSRTAFYSITACAAAGMLLFQATLNIFGSSDVLPLTGVTLPLVSHGGSSAMSVWGLLAFIKAADERTYRLS